jgi:hypothetical protein
MVMHSGLTTLARSRRNQASQHLHDAHAVGGEMTDRRHQMSGDPAVDDHRPPDRPFVDMVEDFFFIVGVQRGRDVRWVGVAGVDDLQRDLARSGQHLLHASVSGEPEPRAQCGMPAHQKPEIGRHVVDSGIRKKGECAANAQWRSLILHG